MRNDNCRLLLGESRKCVGLNGRGFSSGSNVRGAGATKMRSAGNLAGTSNIEALYRPVSPCSMYRPCLQRAVGRAVGLRGQLLVAVESHPTASAPSASGQPSVNSSLRNRPLPYIRIQNEASVGSSSIWNPVISADIPLRINSRPYTTKFRPATPFLVILLSLPDR